MPISVPIISQSGARTAIQVADPVISQPPSGGQLSLFVTEAELAVWKTRAASGPYKATGDVRANSPGDWNRIVANKNSFMSNPTASRWGGPSASNQGWSAAGGVGSTWGWSTTPMMLGYNGPHEKLNQAAFYALVMQDQAVAAAVANQLVIQINYQDTVFGNRTRWWVANPGNGNLSQQTLYMSIGTWLGSRIVAFDYLEAYEKKYNVILLSSSQKSSFKQWCKDFGYFIEPHLHAYVGRSFVDRKANNYTLTSTGTALATWTPPPTDSSGTMRQASAFYHNRNGNCFLGMAMAGIISGDAFLIGEAKRFFKEIIRFSHAPTWHAEFHRGHDPRPSEGIKYTSMHMSSIAIVAEMLRATGDTELYDYNTSSGTDQTSGQYNGQNRSLKTACDMLLRLVSGQLNITHDGVRFAPASTWTSECEYATCQRFYKDADWNNIYQRVGITGFPANPEVAWSHPHTPGGGVFPAAHLCFIKLGV